MGNKAIITNRNKQIGIYLHWNGGRDSVEAFLKYCSMRGFRTGDYGAARLTQVVANFFGGMLCIGIVPYTDDERMVSMGSDNGVYIVEDWEIVGRIYPYEGFVEQSGYDMDEMLKAIDIEQPVGDRLGKMLDAELMDVSEIGIGDTVFMSDFTGHMHAFTVAGFGSDRMLNGVNVKGVPYVNKYGPDNINSYIQGAKAYAIKWGSVDDD